MSLILNFEKITLNNISKNLDFFSIQFIFFLKPVSERQFTKLPYLSILLCCYCCLCVSLIKYSILTQKYCTTVILSPIFNFHFAERWLNIAAMKCCQIKLFTNTIKGLFTSYCTYNKNLKHDFKRLSYLKRLATALHYM